MLKINKKQLYLLFLLMSLNKTVKLSSIKDLTCIKTPAIETMYDNNRQKIDNLKIHRNNLKKIYTTYVTKRLTNQQIINQYYPTINLELRITNTEVDKVASFIDNKKDILEISYGSKADNIETLEARNKYFDIITKYANMYGIDNELVFAQACQERMTHSDIIDAGGAIGLMQIQASVWIGHTLQAYNYDMESLENIEITEELLKSLDGNIKVSCAIMQQYLKSCNYNSLVALQSYNYGNIVKTKIIPSYAEDNEISEEEILNDPTNTEWIEYCKYYSEYGDENYVNNVLCFYSNKNSSLNYKTPNGNVSIPIKYKEQNAYCYTK